MYVFEHFDDHSDEEINDKYKYQIQEDKKENLGGLKFSAYQVAKIAWLYEDWRSQFVSIKVEGNSMIIVKVLE